MNIIKKKVSALTGPTGSSHKHCAIMRWSTWQLLQPHLWPIPPCHVSIPLILLLSAFQVNQPIPYTHFQALSHHSEDFLSNFTWFQSHTLLEVSDEATLTPSTDWGRRRFLFFFFLCFLPNLPLLLLVLIYS